MKNTHHDQSPPGAGSSGGQGETTSGGQRGGSFAWALLGVDISLNDDTAKGDGLSWQLQLYGTAAALDPKTTRAELSRRLRSHVSRDEFVSRPIRLKHCDGTAYALSYALKTAFTRRVAYRYSALGTSGWNTRKVQLKPREHVALLLFLHEQGLGKRLLLQGVKVISKAGRARLRLVR